MPAKAFPVWIGILASLSSAVTFAEDAKQTSAIGRSIGEFELQDFRGKSHRLSDYEESKIVVVAFVGTECPLVKLYAKRLGEMDAEYKKRGVTFYV